MWVPSSSAALAVGQVAMETLKLEVFSCFGKAVN